MVGMIHRPESKSGTTLKDAVRVANAPAAVASGRARDREVFRSIGCSSPHDERGIGDGLAPRCCR